MDAVGLMKRLAWDNANIIESYPGVCTPLTFSFARASYRDVYAQLMDAFHLDQQLRLKIRRDYDAFLGYLDGRFYYNLETWCILASYLPGTQRNPAMLQEMMGVRPDDRLNVPPPRLPRGHNLKGILLGLRYHFQLPTMTRRWMRNFENDFPGYVNQVEQIHDAQVLMDLYFTIERRFLFQWAVPILNDIAVMVYTGSLRRMARRRYGTDLDPAWLMDIGSGGNVRMIGILRTLANHIKQSKEIARIVADEDHERAWKGLFSHPTTAAACSTLMDNFGMRNGNDLKLETPNFREQPGAFISILRQYVQAESLPAGHEARTTPIHWQFRWLLNQARRSINQREEMRLKRSQIFGLVREIFVKLGQEFANLKVVDLPDDIFFLEVEECWQIIRGTSTTINVRPMITQRRREYVEAKTKTMSSHIISQGVPQRDTFTEAVHTNHSPVLVGRPNYPATVEADVVVMIEPNFKAEVRGKILVCPQTDPSWTPILGLVGGLIVERGGILSHAAIFSRELRIPSILGVEGVCRVLRTGQRVRLDGRAGKVTIV